MQLIILNDYSLMFHTILKPLDPLDFSWAAVPRIGQVNQHTWEWKKKVLIIHHEQCCIDQAESTGKFYTTLKVLQKV
jgi:hypothetical protein